MPRTTALGFRLIAYAESSGDGVLHLITIDHPSMGGEPLRFVRNGEAIVSNGETYNPSWFEIVPPSLQADGGYSQSALQIDAVDQVMVAAVRELEGPATLEHSLILISAPNTQIGPWNYEIRGEVNFNRLSMSLPLTFEPVLQEQCPYKRLSPGRAPGLF